MWITILIIAPVVFLIVCLLLFWLGRCSDCWGATPEEIDMPLPGDGWLEGGPPVHVRLTRAVWVAAPPE